MIDFIIGLFLGFCAILFGAVALVVYILLCFIGIVFSAIGYFIVFIVGLV